MVKFIDKAPIGKVEITADGYLKTRARALRSGVYEYHSSELGMMGDRMMKVYRPEESVFAKDSLQSAAHIPVTMGHPKDGVDAETWKELSSGEVGSDVLRDGEWATFGIMVKDQAAIDAVNSGVVELSPGYEAELFEAKDSEYDFVMGPPRYNHLAIVDKARGGEMARIGDNAATNWGAAPVTMKQEREKMETVKIMVGDQAFTVAEENAPAFNKLIADHKAALADKDQEIGALKAECAEANAKVLSDEQLDEIMAARVEMASMREKVKETFGDEAAKEPDEQIKGMFKVIDKAAKKDDVREALKNRDQKKNKTAWGDIIADMNKKGKK